MMLVKDCMTRTPKTCKATDTLEDAARTMADGDFGAVPVVENGRPIGIITDRDIAVRAVARHRTPWETPVREVMSDRCITVAEDSDALEAVRLMEQQQIRRLIVLDGKDRVSGIVATADLAIKLHDHDKMGEVLEEVSKPGRARSTAA